MTEIQFHDTLSGKTEPFVPLVARRSARLHMWTYRLQFCAHWQFSHVHRVSGPFCADFLKSRGFRILQVMNLTDVDDRIIQKAAASKHEHPRSTPTNIFRHFSTTAGR